MFQKGSLRKARIKYSPITSFGYDNPAPLMVNQLESMHDNRVLEELAHNKAQEAHDKIKLQEMKEREEEMKRIDLIRKKEMEEKKKQIEFEKKTTPQPMDLDTVPADVILERPKPAEPQKENIKVQLADQLGGKKLFYTQIIN